VTGEESERVLRTLAARLDRLEQLPRDWTVIGNAVLGPDDVLFVRPTHMAMTPNDAREYQDVLEAKLNRQVVVLPFPAEVALTHVAKTMTADLLGKTARMECELNQLRQDLMNRTGPRLYTGP
jgi:hypothetical protein